MRFALVAITNLLGQVTKTPVCYAYLPGRESTLKYKFSYGEEKFYTNLRFIKGSENAFKAGDRIIMKAEGDKTITFSVKEDMLEQASSGYIPFETSAEELDNLQKGITGIVLVRDGQTFPLLPIKDNFAYTKKNARMLTQNAYTLEKKKIISEKKEASKEAKDIGIPSAFYHRWYLGYSPLRYNHISYDDLNIGYTSGIRLGKAENKTYLQFGLQFDWMIVPNPDFVLFPMSPEEIVNTASSSSKLETMNGTANDIAEEAGKDELSISIPIGITQRFYLGKSNVALSPFASAIFKINPRHSTEDRMLFQPGFEVGVNLDYKSFYFGTLYHMDFFVGEGQGNRRGLAARIGFSF